MTIDNRAVDPDNLAGVHVPPDALPGEAVSRPHGRLSVGGSRWAGLGAGLALGALTGVVELVCSVVAGLILVAVCAWPRPRSWVLQRLMPAARWLTAVECWRLGNHLKDGDAAGHGHTRGLRYLAVRWTVGLLGGIVLGLLGFGLFVAGTMVFAWLTGGTWAFIEDSGGGVSTRTLALALLPGLILFYLDLAGRSRRP